MDGVTQVQTRISEIQSRFVYRTPRRVGQLGQRGAAAAGPRRHQRHVRLRLDRCDRVESAVVAEAQKYLGVPYLWGGTDPAKGLDCSGFTQLVFGNLGIDLPRTSSQQATAGPAVASSPPPARATWSSSTTRRREPASTTWASTSATGRWSPPPAGRGGQGPGRRQPDRDPPGAPAADDGATGTPGRPSAGCPTPTCSPRPPAATGWTPRCWPRWPSRSRASTPRRSRPPERRASCSSCRPPRRAWGQRPRPDVGDQRRRQVPQQPDQAVRLDRPGPGRLQRRPRHGEPLRRHPALPETQNYVRAVMTKAEAYR